MANEYGVVHYECKVEKLPEESDSAGGEASVATEGYFRKHKLAAGKCKYYYGVSIVTGNQEGAGTPNPGVYITLVGNKGQSGKIQLLSFLNILAGKSIDTGTCSNVVIESSGDLGEVLVVILGIDKGHISNPLSAPWYVDDVGVYNYQIKQQELFPCYHWLGNGERVSFTAHTTILKNVCDNKILRTQRDSQLLERRSKYGWMKSPSDGLPSHIDDGYLDLPIDERFERVKSINFTTTSVDSGVKIKLQSGSEEIEDLHDYEVMATILGDPEVPVHNAARWTTDVEFGRQMLNGMNPVVIEKCTKLPSNFPVTNDMVKGFLNRGLTLEQEMKAGHVYMCDLKIMDGLPTREGQYCAAPICLLYVNGSDQLVPIAIQLKQNPGKENPIFLPSDGWIDWLLAKIYYQSAHAQFHQLSTHYFSCHAAMEAYGMATMRNLPDPHPIFKLLRPYFRYTMAINSAARATLINDGGIIDMVFAIGGKGKIELMRRASAHYSVQWTNVVRCAKQRGVDSQDQLPGYHYRDDGVKIWYAIERFVTNLIDEFYKTDEEVKGDMELQSWAEDIHTNAFPGYFGAKDGHGFPSAISSKKELAEYCTLIVFTGSAQHSSINFGQYDIYGFIPNASFTLRQPPPTKKSIADYSTLLQTLPGKDDTGSQISTVRLLSGYSDDEIYLGKYETRRFTEETPKRLIVRFQEELDRIAGEIYTRNMKLDVPYNYLLPSRIPNSITI